MNIYVAVGIFGIISNFVAALADLPLIKPGKPGENENISLNGVQHGGQRLQPRDLSCPSGYPFLDSRVLMLPCGFLQI